jgi:hypothetical protein
MEDISMSLFIVVLFILRPDQVHGEMLRIAIEYIFTSPPINTVELLIQGQVW